MFVNEIATDSKRMLLLK